MVFTSCFSSFLSKELRVFRETFKQRMLTQWICYTFPKFFMETVKTMAKLKEELSTGIVLSFVG
jgi:hypothetical protein